jgi:hypothetical protein
MLISAGRVALHTALGVLPHPAAMHTALPLLQGRSMVDWFHGSNTAVAMPLSDSAIAHRHAAFFPASA